MKRTRTRKIMKTRDIAKTKNKVARIRDVARTKNNDGNAFENIQQSNRYDEENHEDEGYRIQRRRGILQGL